ncbi:TetR/AcrR family transcriptional regulator [Sphingomonas sp.]|uniref:TetR/AcrR family transcriptional regulator n=1 Tax=Sphingomonas sp. TaxID=28214 RepID=UPI0025E0294D|nr:TetR/AcrR family transcriptional regulator [Sphingomonas sp.]
MSAFDPGWESDGVRVRGALAEPSSPARDQRAQRDAERRAAIVAIAKDSFLDKGYEATTMSEIAKTLGGSKGTLWNHFSSKEELLRAVFDTVASAFPGCMATILVTQRDIREVLTRFCETFITRISDPQAIGFQRLVIAQADRIPEIARIFFNGAPALDRAMLTDFVGRQMTAGLLRSEAPAHAAGMLLDLCVGGYHNRILYGFDTFDADRAASEATRVVDQFMHCYCAIPDVS